MPANFRLQPGLFACYSQMLEAGSHRHHAIQLTIPEGSAELAIEGATFSGASLLAPNVMHQLDMESGWVWLVEPESTLGEVFLERLNGDTCISVKALSCDVDINQQFDFVSEWTEKQSPHLSRHRIPMETEYVQLDSRIQDLLERLNQCFGQVCVKPDHWRASDVAEEVALSESRFLHLFKENMGIAWRPYLLWRRLLCAIGMLNSGKSATESAYMSGFADSAHLSRTFKQHFGLTIREAIKLFEQH
ncbi:AraC family transcriptional regulator [Vibrio sp. vnigr-6D03]|uniref:helix-turn-helix transcriptional regulator n=1 Tax=Vibrio sp. vnigr-6D03 TaxID=2058088 RepID=UPI000C321B7A|nr:AraC family transcriptional regulator [Vibrio sp. vnigr-6D03]PKF79915.1 AraC family transcriptional regulator [Vibrio sp. vnigr-6D03]